MEDLRAPFRQQFDNARDPYTARNALGILDAAGAASSADFPAGAWTAWSPTISASVGTITSSTVNVARYTKAGKTITAYFDFTINDQGSGSAFLQISLPVAVSASGGGFAAAQEIDVTGMLFMGALTASNTLVRLVAYNGVGIVTTGHRLLGMIIYESV